MSRKNKKDDKILIKLSIVITTLTLIEKLLDIIILILKQIRGN